MVDIYHTLKEYTSNIDVYDPWANADKVKTDYQIMIQNHMTNKKYDAIILAVAHKQFQDFNFDRFKRTKLSFMMSRNLVKKYH